MREGMSQRAYARRCGVYVRAIQHTIETGVIVPFEDGSIEVEQADASWGALRVGHDRPGPVPRAEREARDRALRAVEKRKPEWSARLDTELDALEAYWKPQLDDLLR